MYYKRVEFPMAMIKTDKHSIGEHIKIYKNLCIKQSQITSFQFVKSYDRNMHFHTKTLFARNDKLPPEIKNTKPEPIQIRKIHEQHSTTISL